MRKLIPRFITNLLQRKPPPPTEDVRLQNTPADEPEPEWKRRFRVINELCEQRKEEFRLAGGGRIEKPEP